MHQLLKIGDEVKTQGSEHDCRIIRFLGAGTQGEVYLGDLGGSQIAVKWYFPTYLPSDPRLRERLEEAIRRGAPTPKFLWPLELVAGNGHSSFGYIMAFREPRFKSIIDLVRRRVEPTFRALATAGFELAYSYHELHAKGLCYRDINFENVMFDPANGDIRVCDNDNVDVNGTDGAINGTPSFMAPELVRGAGKPSTLTDLHSLAILLFYMFVVHHPLDGERETKIRCLDMAARAKLYGTEPIFIHDPKDDSNRPVRGLQDNAIDLWNVYPKFLCDLFTTAFTKGLANPNARIVETQWRQAMIELRDSIIYCSRCSVENFYDKDHLRQAPQQSPRCWHCHANIPYPPRIRIGQSVVMLNHDSKLFAHHVDTGRKFDFSDAMADIARHPSDPSIWGLRNLSANTWVVTKPDGTMREVEPGRSINLEVGTKVNFGKTQGEIRL